MMRRSTFLILHVLACRLLVPSFAATGDAPALFFGAEGADLARAAAPVP